MTSNRIGSKINMDMSHQQRDSEKAIFERARTHLDPGALFRFVTYLFAERKMVVLFWIHFMATAVVWLHYGILKFHEQAMTIPEGASNYWLKRLLPPFIFGSKHAILLQMALLPLTMSRFSIAEFGGSILNEFVPFNRALRMHIYMGYTMVAIVVFATLFFFVAYGTLCARGEQLYCQRFRSEVMLTGYAITFFCLLIAGSSYYRHKFPYEIFYRIHYLVFLLYIITIAHTFDTEHRSGKHNRYQTFQWVSASILYYICDRSAMKINHKYTARLVSSSTVAGSEGSKMVILKLHRPVLLNFNPGQYAFIRIVEIDDTWHPFSMASGPDASLLEFYIEVFDRDSWTAKLWQLLEGGWAGGNSNVQIDVDVMGPYGTSLAKMEDFSHALTIGTGTGIVPMISLYKQHIRQLSRLEPKKHFAALAEHQRRVRKIERAEEPRKGSAAKKAVTSCCLDLEQYEVSERSKRDTIRQSIHNSIYKFGEISSRFEIDESHNDCLTKAEPSASSVIRGNIRQMKKAAFQATRSIYGVCLLAILPVIGVTLIALTISWNTIEVDLPRGMIMCLLYFSATFQGAFAFVSLFVWDANNFLVYVDTAFLLLCPFIDWYWFHCYALMGSLRTSEILEYCFVMGYMTVRVWSMTVRPRHRSWKRHVANDGVAVLERLDLVWVARSAALVSELLPDINEVWEDFVEIWGEENARDVCRISIYVTDKDSESCELLKREVSRFGLCQSIIYGRPNFEEMIEELTLDLICTRRNSCSVLAFCGSPVLSQKIHQYKISNDMVTAMTGNKNHQWEYMSESYGGTKDKAKTKTKTKKQPRIVQSQSATEINTVTCSLSDSATAFPDVGQNGLTTRKTTRFAGHHSGTMDSLESYEFRAPRNHSTIVYDLPEEEDDIEVASSGSRMIEF